MRILCEFIILFNYRDCIGLFTSNEEFYVFDTKEHAFEFINKYDDQFYYTKVFNKIE